MWEFCNGDIVCEATVGWKNKSSSLKVGDGEMSSFVELMSVVGVCVTKHKCRLCSDSERAVLVVGNVEELSFVIGGAVGDTKSVVPSPNRSIISS